MKEALDSARAALRGGAAEVTIVSLENFDEMPVLRTTQGHEEFEEAKKEGVAFLPRRGPSRFLGRRPPRGGRAQAGRLGLRRERPLRAALRRERPRSRIEADACVLAIGQQPDLSFLKPADGVALTPGGTIRVDPATLATSAPGVFAGGDVAFGPRNLIEAVANGKRAARSIHEYLSREAPRRSRPASRSRRSRPPRYRMIAGFEIFDREAPPTLDVGRRTGIAEVETGYGEAEARRQAARCLVCHVQTIYDPEKCVLCNRCVDVCPEYCLAIVPFEELDLRARRSARPSRRAPRPTACRSRPWSRTTSAASGAGSAPIRCPTDAMTMERFSITERFAARGAS